MKRDGWAIECRINAEDPFRNFLPSTGRLVRFQPPEDHVPVRHQQKLGVRVDTGVYEGGEIPMYYDSMIAKLIVHGTDRNDAIAKMRAALNGFVIRGISSNIPFQAALLAHPKFVSGQFNTGFIAEHYGKGFVPKTCRATRCSWWPWPRSCTAPLPRARLGISGQLAGHEVKVGEQFVVVVLGRRAEPAPR